MKKKILVVGGSYFIGRVFTISADRSGAFDVHVLNRGRYSLRQQNITEYVCDRNDGAGVATCLEGHDWDAVIDFCAYTPGDTKALLQAMPGTVQQYILLSSCSVYDASASAPKDETSPLIEALQGNDPGSQYAYDKRLLEAEAESFCAKHTIALTRLRPSFVYGPFNYAPREPYYFECILQNQTIPVPDDATGKFSFVHVGDIARMIRACIGNKDAYGQVFNLSAPEVLNYSDFMAQLEAAHQAPLQTISVTVQQALEEGLPLPFPLQEDERYCGKKASETLHMAYTPFADGLTESYMVYMKARNA